MADLHARVEAVQFASPILAAAGPLTETGEDMATCAASGAAGVVARTVSWQPAPAAPAPRTSEA